MNSYPSTPPPLPPPSSSISRSQFTFLSYEIVNVEKSKLLESLIPSRKNIGYEGGQCNRKLFSPYSSYHNSILLPLSTIFPSAIPYYKLNLAALTHVAISIGIIMLLCLQPNLVEALPTNPKHTFRLGDRARRDKDLWLNQKSFIDNFEQRFTTPYPAITTNRIITTTHAFQNPDSRSPFKYYIPPQHHSSIKSYVKINNVHDKYDDSINYYLTKKYGRRKDLKNGQKHFLSPNPNNLVNIATPIPQSSHVLLPLTNLTAHTPHYTNNTHDRLSSTVIEALMAHPNSISKLDGNHAQDGEDRRHNPLMPYNQLNGQSEYRIQGKGSAELSTQLHTVSSNNNNNTLLHNIFPSLISNMLANFFEKHRISKRSPRRLVAHKRHPQPKAANSGSEYKFSNSLSFANSESSKSQQPSDNIRGNGQSNSDLIAKYFLSDAMRSTHSHNVQKSRSTLRNINNKDIDYNSIEYAAASEPQIYEESSRKENYGSNQPRHGIAYGEESRRNKLGSPDKYNNANRQGPVEKQPKQSSSHYHLCDANAGHFKCPSLDSRGKIICVEDSQICDGTFHCPLGEDEDGVACLMRDSVSYRLSQLMQMMVDLNDQSQTLR